MSDTDETATATTETPDGPKALREAYDAQKAELAALKQQLAETAKASRQSTIANVLRDKAANEGLAPYIAGDLGDNVTAESVAQWLTEKGPVFGYTASAESEQQQTAEQQAAQEQLTQTQAAISAASAGAAPALTGWTPERIKGSSFQQLVEAGLLDPK